MLSRIWFAMMAAAALWGAITGRMGEVSAGALDGASASVELCFSVAGPLILWAGVGEVLRRAGALRGLSRLLRPALRRLLGRAADRPEIAEAVSANVGANLLGLGNAATPPGMAAAEMLGRLPDPRPLERFLVLNTASLQLIPASMAAVRSACGAAEPFDIVPAVWLASAGALAAALLALRLFQGRRA